MRKAVLQWNGLHSDIIPLRIHGVKDHIIPCPKDVDVRINGGHLIAMTHPEECIAAIKLL